MKSCDFTFSIIVAIYNTERYLDECITSVINQDVGFKKNVELILVNDGSTDKSDKICRKYQKLYPENIKYFFQENKGVSSARNVGLNNCNGKYINFLDSDDKFSLNALSVAKSIFKKNANVKICAIKPYFFGKVNGETNVEYCFKENKLINLISDGSYVQQSASNIFIESSLLSKLKFNEKISIGEDALFVNSIFLNCPEYYVTNKALYFQRRRESNDSLSESAFNNKSFYIDTVKKYFVDMPNRFLKKYGYVPDFLQNELAAYIAWILQSNVLTSILSKKDIREYINNLKKACGYIEPRVYLNNKNVEDEYKYIITLLRKDEFGIDFKANSVNLKINDSTNKFEYIYTNHSIVDLILNDTEKLVLYSIEKNKFYLQELRLKEDLQKRLISCETELDESRASDQFNRKKIEHYEAQVIDMSEKIKAQELIIKETNAKLNKLYKDLKAIKENELFYKKELEKVLNSKSWKATKPLRKLSSLIYKYNGGIKNGK